MPETLRFLPLTMALEPDDKDDAKTKRGKDAAREAVEEVERRLRAEQDAKMGRC